MIITDQQIDSLGTRSKDEFIEKTIAFLKENTPIWAGHRNDEEIRSHVERMIEEGKGVEVRKEINIQKLLYNWVRYDLVLPFTERIEEILATKDQEENYRVKRLIKEIRKNGVR